tara:strand:+ start:3532 stop:3936 length:405 start_codon:yes stop_codon:yes gene_type:complete
MKSIYEFKKGDRIVRVEPAKTVGKNMLSPEGVRDRSFIGDKMILAGVANGCIYLKRTDKIEIKIFGDKLLDLPLDIFDEGWDYYIDPDKLLEDVNETIHGSQHHLKKALDRAVSEENYEMAEKLRKALENLEDQ